MSDFYYPLAPLRGKGVRRAGKGLELLLYEQSLDLHIHNDRGDKSHPHHPPTTYPWADP